MPEQQHWSAAIIASFPVAGATATAVGVMYAVGVADRLGLRRADVVGRSGLQYALESGAGLLAIPLVIALIAVVLGVATRWRFGEIGRSGVSASLVLLLVLGGLCVMAREPFLLVALALVATNATVGYLATGRGDGLALLTMACVAILSAGIAASSVALSVKTPAQSRIALDTGAAFCARIYLHRDGEIVAQILGRRPRRPDDQAIRISSGRKMELRRAVKRTAHLRTSLGQVGKLTAVSLPTRRVMATGTPATSTRCGPVSLDLLSGAAPS